MQNYKRQTARQVRLLDRQGRIEGRTRAGGEKKILRGDRSERRLSSSSVRSERSSDQAQRIEAVRKFDESQLSQLKSGSCCGGRPGGTVETQVRVERESRSPPQVAVRGGLEAVRVAPASLPSGRMAMSRRLMPRSKEARAARSIEVGSPPRPLFFSVNTCELVRDLHRNDRAEASGPWKGVWCFESERPHAEEAAVCVVAEGADRDLRLELAVGRMELDRRLPRHRPSPCARPRPTHRRGATCRPCSAQSVGSRVADGMLDRRRATSGRSSAS